MTGDGAPQYVFVLGTGRCGSTLVQEALARHPEAAFVSNLDDLFGAAVPLRRWNNSLYRMLPPSLTRKGRMRFAPSEAYRVLDRRVSPILSRPWRDLTARDVTPWLRDRLRSYFDAQAGDQGKPVFLHKFTGWPRAGFLAGVFPGARFVHVVRDGRAVASSWLQMEWWEGFRGPGHWQWGPLPDRYADEWRESAYSFPILAGVLWKLLLDAHDSAAAEIPRERWLEVRYEDVIARPGDAFRQLVEFSGLRPDPRFDRELARMRFEGGRAAAFRKDLGPDALEALSRSLAAHLERRGYEV